MMLSSQTIKELIDEKNKPLIEGFVDLDKQLQQSGFDFTLEKVYLIEGEGVLDFDNSNRKIPSNKEMEFDKSDFIKLEKGTYKIRFNETVHLPSNIAAMAKPRSSLLRMGATIYSALWDPGFEGKSESMLVVENKKGIKLKKNAKLMQFVFFQLDKKSDRLYNGVYKNIK